MLDLVKALSFFLDILLLYAVAISAFFVPGSSWPDRLDSALEQVALFAVACLLSGLLFNLAPGSRSISVRSFLTTMPIQLFFWGVLSIAILFVSSWYFASYPCTLAGNPNCGL